MGQTVGLHFKNCPDFWLSFGFFSPLSKFSFSVNIKFLENTF